MINDKSAPPPTHTHTLSLQINKDCSVSLVSGGGVGCALVTEWQLGCALVTEWQLGSRYAISFAGAASGGSVTTRFTLLIWVVIQWVQWSRLVGLGCSIFLVYYPNDRQVEAFSHAVGGRFCLVLWEVRAWILGVGLC